MRRLFGTDGVRGLANGELLTPEFAVGVCASAARTLSNGSGRRPVAVVGRDPRASGEMLESAVVAGLTSAGADAIRVGILPTPGVAHLVAETGADLGVMISASHNPMPDNGIKLFAAGGHKLPDDVEAEIERGLDRPADGRPTGDGIGRVWDAPDATGVYVAHLLEAAPGSLNGVRVIVDCAHGAASVAAPEAYRQAGADVIALHAEPDGLNINDGVGSTHLEPLRAAVREQGADLGIAHDGDADRCLAVDAAGNVVDGDQIMAVLALAMRDAGELAHDTLVATVMSNLGLHLAMRDAGITLDTTKVGDRYVLERLREGGFTLGGEQSGHVVLPGHATTGDGLLTALRLMSRMASTGSSLAELAAVVTPLPQVLRNVAVGDRDTVAASAQVAEAVATASAELGETGRVLLRPSGTEQLVRVMVEAPTAAEADAVAGRLAEVVAAAS
ncbi:MULTISPECIES: phosphoglucosamine mutase [unclassified Pseudonocardia]|uniref:phosphoglucosamine mutase n=1 Tax=unclassified Pseudonocardia TaxID=2619320 RepID=UPI0001FFF1E2|nr:MULTISPECIES: phosphoglucosamine mutase [unclassified Pseudonocardia]ALE72221.1 phosphoglucosamine mutase [Pseudonocardia sp. EC080625-04]ALL75506.1 phosphoglucosamine mutase [Pseudonocardia sp. EC080610-09]ALL82532.1 phosphoglucosamine mutase [Pseudonocardia sp. EC080619-01]OLM20686.1 Phosphoglucosamine mutase [Pseudonocardia sp. Ae707_Ps1]